MEDLKKHLIIDEKEYEKERIPDLIRKILRYGKVTTEGKVILEKSNFTLRKKINRI